MRVGMFISLASYCSAWESSTTCTLNPAFTGSPKAYRTPLRPFLPFTKETFDLGFLCHW